MRNTRILLASYVYCLIVGWVTAASAQEEPGTDTIAETTSEAASAARSDRTEKILERITVVGTGEDSGLIVPGSARVLKGEQLESLKIGFDDVNRILRDVPGVNIQEEDGYGLRPNIGFRGTPVERSDSITLMEDGVLIAPAPYSAPAAYYFPTAGRMEAIEVTKGPGLIKYGPRTTGGALNMISRSIPDRLSLNANVGAGSDSTKKIHVAGGSTSKYAGFMLETYQLETEGFKKLDGGGDTGFDLQDYIGKFRLNTDPNAELYQEMEFKIGNYDQDSNETYLGLTQEDFDDSPFRRYRGSQLDNIKVEHEQYQLRHYLEVSDSLDFTTVAYRNDTDRNWYKLESVGGASISSIMDSPEEYSQQLDWIRGVDSPDDALAVRENRRSYYGQGIQTAAVSRFSGLGADHRLELGARYHEDEEDRFQQEDKYKMIGGKMVLTTAGDPGSNANRIGSASAWAFYAQDEITVDRWILTPGLRYENISYTREDWGKTDPNRTGKDLVRNTNSLDVYIPGIGTLYKFTDELAGFAGVHKGFSPPGPTSDSSVKEEESVNYELGARFHRSSLTSELVFFYTDYDNLLGADTLSGGGSGSGDLFNGGAATAKGIEALVGWDLGKHYELPIGVPMSLAYTYTDSEFDSSFTSDFFGDVVSGDTIPYIAPNVVSATVGVQHEKFGSLTLRCKYVDAMLTVPGNSTDRGGPMTDSHVVFDASAEYPLFENASLYFDALNLFDSEYVVARRPAGARPGLPFTVLGGVKINLG